MKVKELIQKLKNCDQNKRIKKILIHFYTS
jgi:hypothetical protein